MSQGRAAVSSLGSEEGQSDKSETRWGCFNSLGNQRKRGALETGSGVILGWTVTTCCSPGCRSCGDPWSLGESKKFMLGKRHGHAVEQVLTESLSWGVFILFFPVGKNLRGGFQWNIHQLSRCIFNALMHQNESMGWVGSFFGLLHCFTFILGLCGPNGVFVIYSPEIICLYLPQMALIGSLFSISQTREI